MTERYVSTKDIAKATGLTQSTVIRRAKKEKWETREPLGKGKRSEFVFNKLPEDIKALFDVKDSSQTALEGINQERHEEFPENNNKILQEPQGGAKKEGNNHAIYKEPPEAKIEDNGQTVQVRQKEINEIIKKLETKSVIIMGKNGIGKTYLLELAAQKLSTSDIVVHFKEPPTAKTILSNIAIAAGKEWGNSKEDTLKNLEGYTGKRIVLCIDQLERMTPGSIDVLDKLLLKFQWFKFLGAGHLGSKKRYNSTWLKAQGYILHPLSREDSIKLINEIWKDGDTSSKKIIVNESRGIPGNIVRMASEARQGIMPKEKQKYLDFTPIILVIATLGLAIRAIGYGYSSMESYIIGGVIAAIFWGAFWIYRGYVAGWWGTKRELKKKT